MSEILSAADPMSTPTDNAEDFRSIRCFANGDNRRAEMKEAKRRLYLTLLNVPREELTATEIELGHQLALDPQMQELIGTTRTAQDAGPVQRVDVRRGAAGHIEAALKEADEISGVYKLELSAAMVTLKRRLKIALEELGDAASIEPAETLSRPSKPRVIPKWQVLEATENVPGGCGPDFSLIYLRGGRVLEVGDEGICVWRSFAHFVSGTDPAQSLTFGDGAADSPSVGLERHSPRQPPSTKGGA